MIPSVKTRGGPGWEGGSENHVMLTLRCLRINQKAISSRLKQVRDISIVTGRRVTINDVDAGYVFRFGGRKLR